MPHMDSFRLKLLTWTFKLLAILVAFVMSLLLMPPRWGLNPVADVQVCVLAAISLVPNRTLVFSKIAFAIFLLITLFPFHVFFIFSAYKNVDFESVLLGSLVALMFFAPSPLSLTFSRIRLSRGEKIFFA